MFGNCYLFNQPLGKWNTSKVRDVCYMFSMCASFKGDLNSWDISNIKETYGIVAQIQRAAVSIPANISEGCGRNSNKEFSRFLDVALGSAFELFTLITLSVELNFIDKIESESILHEISEIQKMIYGLKQKLNNK